MCIVSYVSDQWTKSLPQKYPQTFPYNPWVSPPEQTPGYPAILPKDWVNDINAKPVIAVSREEFDALKKEVLELKELLKAAKKFDEATNQPDCETEEKMALLRALAKQLGVELEI